MVKRLIDVFLGSIVLIATAPLLLLGLAIVYFGIGRPILFRQVRPGLGGKPFTLFKLRTMVDLRDHTGELLDDSFRLPPVGRFLRRTSLDELPQLFNVLRGDMSLVGPRPLLTEYLPLYSPEQARRHDVRPGITGWAQVNGRNALTWEEKFKLDVWYVDHQSFWLDLRIIGMTFARVLASKGIDAGHGQSVKKFTGSR